MPVRITHPSGPRRPAGVSRLGVVMGSLATAGTLAVAFFGLGGPPAPVRAVALPDATPTSTPVQQVVVKTIYVQLPSPTAVPIAATPAPKAPTAVVTRQSGAGGDDGNETEGDD